MLWEVDVHPAPSQPDRAARRLAESAAAAGLGEGVRAAAARGYLIQGEGLGEEEAARIARDLLTDAVVERAVVARPGAEELSAPPPRLAANGGAVLVHVLLKPGVMDPVAQSAETAVADLGLPKPAVRTLRKYWLTGVDEGAARRLSERVLANDAIEQVVIGPLRMERIDAGKPYRFELVHVPLAGLDDEALGRLSIEQQLYLQLAEMQTIQRYFEELGRDPTDAELETLAQTWSEHCSHKTLAGRIEYRDENGVRQFENMLKETIFAATNQLRKEWGEGDWCVSVFIDNAGVVRFDEEHNVTFKVETHNHPSALEPYGGANTGLGGVIRDTMGAGLGAKPVCSTDVFCFAPPLAPADALPPGVLHPRRVMQGVVEGVRDYGNRMGIPTVNGAVFFDERYLGNPLVFCGSAGLIPRDKSFKQPQAHDLAVTVGGRTGRDGIHGATFSSAELTSESESLSGGAVQIGNAIEEKRVLDVLLKARDRGLYNAVTDCGAGGFSSAVGEMGEGIGAEVWLEKAPLKYAGLSYTEIWISEAQERMVFAVPKEKWDAFHALSESEGVEATVIGEFMPTGRLVLKYEGDTVADLPMSLLHDGRPPVVRQASYKPKPLAPLKFPRRSDYTGDLLKILGSLNVASKEWIIRQYDHEVQGGSVVKPLVGVASDGPSDAAVVRPKLTSRRGIVLACGMNPLYGDLDTGAMARSAIDEAVRNCVAVGADPERIAVLDNFCWGDCERAETLGSLVRAAVACHDLSLELKTPFISGKDSLNNEFSYVDSGGVRRTIVIPPSLLISAIGQIDDVGRCVTMDLKRAGSALYVLGDTLDELGGSHYSLVNDLHGGAAPRVDGSAAKALYASVHAAIKQGLVASCHDLSEGGLAVALAEMAFAGGRGVEADLTWVSSKAPDLESAGKQWDISDPASLLQAPGDPAERACVALFSESNSRFVCEVYQEHCEQFEERFSATRCVTIGTPNDSQKFRLTGFGETWVSTTIQDLKEAWQSPLRW